VDARIALTSFALVFVAEMGDKTQLLAFTLAARFKKPLPILAGIFVATVLNHTLAAALGTWIAAHVPPLVLGGVLGLGFIAFGAWTLIPDKADDAKPEGKWGPFFTTIVLFFLAEMGDKTQLATAALAARFQNLPWIVVGTTAGMLLADGLAVFFGDRLSRWISPLWMRRVAAALFLATGIWTLAETFLAAPHLSAA